MTIVTYDKLKHFGLLKNFVCENVENVYCEHFQRY
jgi:hypothetical protein